VKRNNIFSNNEVEKRVPKEIYLSLVASLYADKKSLVFGMLGSSLTIFVMGIKTGSLPLYLFAVFLILVGLMRWIDAFAFDKVKDTVSSRASINNWETRYTAGAAIYSAILGAWCFYSFYVLDDTVAQLIATSATLVNMIGVFGRNFGIKRLVNIQMVLLSGPLVAGLISHLDPYLTLLAVMLLPFVLSARAIADRLRSTLLAAVIGKNKVSKLAQQFDTALNNMPQGLCMFDEHSNLVVANEKATQLMGIDFARQTGSSFRSLISSCVKNNLITARDSRRLLQHMEKYTNEANVPPIQVRVSEERTLQFTFQHMENGGTVAVFEDISERLAAEKKIKHMARYDSLTGLPNRAYFRALMNSALSKCNSERNCAVLVLDIDEFKQVNDTLGHPVGDELLRGVADRLKSIAGKNYPVSRFGGDEFVVLLPELRCQEEASALAGIIIDVLKTTFRAGGHEIVVGASIGISSTIDSLANADTLLRNADLALYRAKTQSKGVWRFYQPEMGVQMEARLGLESDLRQALRNDEMHVVFQPLINVKSHRITTCEALVRWQHPEIGNIPPSNFIPLAEEMGLIVEIGQWVLNRACIECSKWSNSVCVAVNLSAIQFKRGDIVDTVKNALAVSGLPPNRLELEITESVMLQDLEETRIILDRLCEIGVQISLDDFGTGYSSLSYLHNLPLHKVKIDRSFVMEINTDEKSLTLCKNIAQMGKQLGLSVVVEGVETEEQLETVTREVNLDEVQGFLFSPPLSADRIIEMVSAFSKSAVNPVGGNLKTIRSSINAPKSETS